MDGIRSIVRLKGGTPAMESLSSDVAELLAALALHWRSPERRVGARAEILESPSPLLMLLDPRTDSCVELFG